MKKIKITSIFIIFGTFFSAWIGYLVFGMEFYDSRTSWYQSMLIANFAGIGIEITIILIYMLLKLNIKHNNI
jgi:hypothetical protein